MKFKVVLLAVVLALIMVAQYVLSTLAGPEIATSLALEQFKNPSIQTDTAQRAYNSSNVFFVAYFGWFLCAIYMFFTDIRRVLGL